MANEKAQSGIRQILRNEITWLIFVIGAVWAFIATVVIPMNSLQITVASINEKLDKEAIKYTQWEERLGQVEKDNAVMLSILKIKSAK